MRYLAFATMIALQVWVTGFQCKVCPQEHIEQPIFMPVTYIAGQPAVGIPDTSVPQNVTP